MRKSGSKTFEDFPSTTLHLDDLKEILSILSENSEKVTLKTGEYDDVVLGEIDELASLINKNRFDDIYISANRPSYITVDLRSYGVRVYISDDNTINRGLVSQIRDVTLRNERKHFGKATNLLGWVPPFLCGIALVEGEYYFAGLMLLLSLFMLLPIVKYQMANKVIVLPKIKEERASFFNRKKDEILVALVGALIGSVVSFILIKFYG